MSQASATTPTKPATYASPGRGRLPENPAAFVAAAEQAINEYDLPATVEAYAERGRLESTTDGAREQFTGIDAITQAWRGYLDGMVKTRFQLRKSLLSAADGVIVNTWTSTFGGRTPGEGIETWRFDGDGKVVDHRMYTFFEIRPSSSIVQRFRLAIAHPRIAVAFLRATARQRRLDDR